jgi:hypothetical protein
VLLANVWRNKLSLVLSMHRSHPRHFRGRRAWRHHAHGFVIGRHMYTDVYEKAFHLTMTLASISWRSLTSNI